VKAKKKKKNLHCLYRVRAWIPSHKKIHIIITSTSGASAFKKKKAIPLRVLADLNPETNLNHLLCNLNNSPQLSSSKCFFCESWLSWTRRPEAWKLAVEARLLLLTEARAKTVFHVGPGWGWRRRGVFEDFDFVYYCCCCCKISFLHFISI